MNSTATPHKSNPHGLPYFVSAGLQQRLDLIHHLIGFGRQIVVVTGDAGCGRSRLLNAVTVDASPEWVLIELDGKDIDTATNLLNVLLDALEPGASDRPVSSADLEARICRQLAQLHSKQRAVVLIVDDCDDFDDDINRLLFRLAHTDNGVGELRVVASCSAGSDYFNRLQACVPKDSSALKLVHLIEIPAIDAVQVDDIARFLGLELSDETLAGITERAQGNAAAAVGLLIARHRPAQPQVPPPAEVEEPDRQLDDDQQSPADRALHPDEVALSDAAINHSASAASESSDSDHRHADHAPPAATSTLKRVGGYLLVFVVALSLVLLAMVDRERKVAVEPIEIDLPDSITTLPAVIDSKPASQPITAPAARDEPARQTITPAVDPPDPNGVGASPAQAATAQSEHAESEETKQDAQSEGPGDDEAVADIAQTDPAGEVELAEPVTEIAAPETSAVAAERTQRPAATAPPQALDKPAYTTKWLLTNSDNTYVIQLFGVRDALAARAFVSLHGLGDKTALMEMEHNGRPWHIVVYGHYPDRAAARAATEQLPSALKISKPWPRSIGSLRK